MSTQPDTKTAPRVPMVAGAQLAAINPTSFDEVTRLAKLAVMAGLTASPDAAEDKAIAKATMAILQGLELGLPAMQSVQGIAIINGKAMIYGDLLTAVLWSRGFKVEKKIEGAGEIRCGYAKITRPDGTVIEKRFSVTDARRARLWREGDNTPWSRFPERMLEWRAFGFAVKDGASDVTRGMYVREEMAPEYNDPIDITPKAVAAPALDIPDIPDGLDAPAAQDAAPQPASDADFLKRFKAAAEPYCNEATFLREIWDVHSDEIAQRGLEQECNDILLELQGEKPAKEPAAETIAETLSAPEGLEIPWEDAPAEPAIEPAIDSSLSKKLAAYQAQLQKAPNATLLKQVAKGWEAFVEGLGARDKVQFQSVFAQQLARVRQAQAQLAR